MNQLSSPSPFPDQLYHIVFEQVTDGLLLLNADGQIRKANPALCQMVGYSQSDLLQRTAGDLIDPWPLTYPSGSEPNPREVQDATTEHRLRGRTGTPRHVRVRTQALDEHHTLLFLQDITTTKALEERLQTSEEKYRLLFETIRDAIFVGGSDGRYVDVNPAAAQLLGVQREQLIGAHYSNFLLAEWHEQAKTVRSEIEATGHWRGEFPMVRGDGSIVWTEYHSQFAQGGVLGVARDVTARKQTEGEMNRMAAQVQQERARLVSLVATVPGVVWEAWGEPDTAAQRIDFVSDYVETMLGYCVAEWLATPNFWLSIVHPEDQAKAGQTAAAQFHSGQGGVNQFRWVTKDGHVLVCEAVAIVIKDEAGQPIGMRGITFDRTALNEAEEALRRSAARYRALVEATSQAVWSIDLLKQTSDFADVQGWWTELTGQPLTTLIELDWLAMVHPDDQAEVRTAWLETLTTGAGLHSEFRVKHRDGNTVCVLARAVPIRTPHGLLQEVVGTFTDVTEQRRAEAALRASEERFAKAFHASPQPMCITSVTDGTYIDVNESFARLVDCPYAEIIGRTSFDVGIWTDPQARAATNRPIIEQGSNRDVEHRFYTQHGELRDIIAAGVFIELDGQPCILSVANDVTARKQAEERLKILYEVSEAVNRAEGLTEVYRVALTALTRILQVKRAAILLLEKDGRMHFRAWLGLSNTYREQVNGHSPWAADEPDPQPVLIPDVTQAALGALQATLLAERIGAVAFIPLVEQGRLLGKFMLYYEHSHHFSDSEVQLAETLARHVAHAIQRKQAEGLLRQLNGALEQRVRQRTAELERSNLELDQFAYVASHDLKTPLRGITQLAQWISEDAEALLPPASKVHLAKLRTRIQRMEKLLDDLLAYSRAGRYAYSKEKVETGALVQSLAELLAPPTFTVTVDGAMPTLVTQRVPLETVLRNLISNAIKHHDRANGHIHVTTQQQSGFIKFTVNDDGPGIDNSYHARIFSMFQTLKPRDAVEGSGMGLAIAKKIVEHQGGSISVESNPGQGASFHFTWPT